VSSSRPGIVLALLIFSESLALAQDQPDPASTARFRFGPVAVTPTVVLKTFGIDTNVFNEIVNPKRDFVTVVGPRADASMRLGRARLTATGSADYAYFSHYSSERSINTEAQAGATVPLRWFAPYFTSSVVDTRERQGYEIDARVRRRETTVRLGTESQLGPRTRLGLGLQHSRIEYDGAALFHDTFVSQTLNRTPETVTASLAYKITPLTTLVVAADSGRERFQFLPARDADNSKVTAGLDFDPFAPLSGKAHVGYRKLNFFDPAIRDFTGPVASVDLAYTVREMTRFATRVERDVGYSFEIQQAYYVTNAITFSMTQSLSGRWDTQVRVGRQWLDYRGTGASTGVQGPRIDSVFTYGAEVGRRTSSTTRLAFQIDHMSRRSPASDRAYNGTHAGTSVTYAF
jgi:hypothetical protein